MHHTVTTTHSFSMSVILLKEGEESVTSLHPLFTDYMPPALTAAPWEVPSSWVFLAVNLSWCCSEATEGMARIHRRWKQKQQGSSRWRETFHFPHSEKDVLPWQRAKGPWAWGKALVHEIRAPAEGCWRGNDVDSNNRLERSSLGTI